MKFDLDDVLRRARWRGQASILQEAEDASFIRLEAGHRGLSVSSAELQTSADDFRRVHKLHDVVSTEQWLAANHLTQDDWEMMLEEDLLKRKLREALTAWQVEKYFAENRLSFDCATISHIVVLDVEAAKELRAQIV